MKESTDVKVKSTDTVSNEELMKLVLEHNTRLDAITAHLARLEGVVQVQVPLSRLPLE